MKLFLYDYINDDKPTKTANGKDVMCTSIILFGYSEDLQKCEVRLTDFDIYCDLAVDYDFFDTVQALTSAIR
jgi:hypothetical protein